VELVAHLEPILNVERCQVGFCVESEELAQTFVEMILAENLEARQAAGHPDGSNAGRRCDVLLPLRPAAPDSEVDNCIVAAVKASHTILCPAALMDKFKSTRGAAS
jgi:hypothetical protein